MIKIPKQCAKLFSLPPADINGGIHLAIVQTLFRLTNRPYTLPDTPFQTSYLHSSKIQISKFKGKTFDISRTFCGTRNFHEIAF